MAMTEISQTEHISPEHTITATHREIVNNWLSRFEIAVNNSSYNLIAELFLDDSHWRDLLAISGRVKTLTGINNITNELLSHLSGNRLSSFMIDPDRVQPRFATRSGRRVLEALFTFNTSQGSASGVLRLVLLTKPNNYYKAWTIGTVLQELKGTKATKHLHLNKKVTSPGQEIFSSKLSKLQIIEKSNTIEQPTVLVVGAGQAGLSTAAQLRKQGIDTVVIEKHNRVGDNWRNRYRSLTLHNQTSVNHLPFLKFPDHWPTYIPKDQLADWFESYADIMKLNVWTQTHFRNATYEQKQMHWNVNLELPNGKQLKIKPHHIVMATGISGTPSIPNIRGIERFNGTIIHSENYTDGSKWKGLNALVIGTGNSGHDIAQDLYKHGSNVTMVQRSSTLITNIEPSAQLVYSLYHEGPNLEDCDLLAAGTPFEPLKESHQILTKKSKQYDEDILKKLEKVGFKLDFGKEETGWQFKYLQTGGGYYFNIGCSDLIADGRIKLLNFSDVKDFQEEGLSLSDGNILPAKLVVFATGYKGPDFHVKKCFGTKLAHKIGPVWGFDERTQELRNMWTKTKQPGLWFIAGGLSQCRIYSKILALQIKLNELEKYSPKK